MTGSLSCPNCGAPAAQGVQSTRCEYCGSALATVACPSCFESIFAGMQFCPHCGAKTARELADDETKPLPCPGCKTDMRVVRVGTTVLRECPSCASNWVDAETFTTMCANREQRGAVAAIVGSTAGDVSPIPGGAVRYLPCPLCKKLMNRTNFGHRSGVIIDVCKGHGAWFEPSELKNVLAFIDSGKFEKARADEEQRKVEELKSLQNQLTGARQGGVVVSTRVVNLHVDTDADAASILTQALQHLLF
jgi:Zn-finger nucleic acid-binding protein